MDTENKKVLSNGEEVEFRLSMVPFFERTNVKGVVLRSGLPVDLPENVHRELLARKRVSWFEPKDGKVYIDVDRLTGFNLGFIHSVILQSAIEGYGFSGLLKEGIGIEKALSEAVGERFDSVKEFEDYCSVHRFSSDQLTAISRVLSEALGLRYFEPSMRYAVLKGISEHRSVALSAARADGVYSLDDKRLGVALDESIRRVYNSSRKGDFLPLGDLGDFIGGRLGYENKQASVDLNFFRQFLVASGLSDSEIVGTDWSSLFMNPLAVINNPRKPDHYFVVLDKHVSGIDGSSPSFLAIYLQKPGKNDDYKYVPARPWGFNDSALLSCLKYAENWVYMKSGKGEGEKFVLLDRLYEIVEKGKYQGEVIKKSGALTAPVNNSGFRSTLLNIANIATYFENTKLFAKKDNGFSEKVVSVAEPAAVKPSRVDFPKEPEAVKPSVPLQDRLKTRISGLYFSKAERDALAKAGILTAGDIMRVGFRGVYEATGRVRTMNKAAQFLESNGIYLVTKNQLESGPAPTPEEVGAHMLEAVLAYSGKDLPVVKPQRLDGSPFEGGDTLHLVASMALEKRNACSVWVTEQELSDLACGVGKASPVPVLIDGKLDRVYNLSSTTFPKMHKDAYKEFVEALSERADCGSVGKYFKSFLWSVSGADMGSYENLVKSFNENTSERVNSLRESNSVSLEDVIGINGIKQMKRVAKSVRMYQELSRVSAGIKMKK